MDAVNGIEEPRGLTRQANLQVATQLQVIDRMGRIGMPTSIVAEALQMLRRTAELHARLNVPRHGACRRNTTHDSPSSEFDNRRV
jgi:hypothetical protein